jgi:site-specific DNA recombinase
MDTTGEYWMMLRKSREDMQAEDRGEGETLAKHKKALFKLAKDMRISITEVFEEVVSGESIFHRPEMLRMLDLMEIRLPKGVLVMDMDRLGRGNMQEQGLILETFRRLKCHIITPTKVYDLSNESDELMTEVQSLLARQELKMITRRMQRGRKASAEEGNYIGTRPPYGYLIHKEGRSRFLVPHPEQASVVRSIFTMYTQDKMGSSKVANKLNELRIPSYDGSEWEPSAILNILKNEVYIGRIQWGKKEQKKSKVPGKKRETRSRDRSEWIVDVKGKHDPLIDEELFSLAKEIRTNRDIVPYDLVNGGITNPLAGIVKCGKCGHSMIMRPYGKQKPHMICSNTNRTACDNRGSRFEYVEQNILVLLGTHLDNYKLKFGKYKKVEKSNTSELKRAALESLHKQMREADGQKTNLYDLLERKIYDDETFLDRSRTLTDKINEIKASILKTENELKQEEKKSKVQKNLIPQYQKVLRSYYKDDDPARKNALLKSVIKSAKYTKEKTQRNEEFTLELTPKIMV